MASFAEMSGSCFGHRSRKAARAVTGASNLRLRPFGLNISQYILLGVISRGEDRSVAVPLCLQSTYPSASQTRPSQK